MNSLFITNTETVKKVAVLVLRSVIIEKRTKKVKFARILDTFEISRIASISHCIQCYLPLW